MAFLFVDSLTQNKSRFLQISVKALELLLLSEGLISILAMVKTAVAPYSCEIVFSSLVRFWSPIWCFLSSPLSICIIIHVMVLLIAASSKFYRDKNDNQDDEIAVEDNDVPIVESFVASPPAPPPSPPRDVVEDGDEDMIEMCSICQEDLHQKDGMIAMLNCGHTYHADCFKQWLMLGKNSCPLCRAKAL